MARLLGLGVLVMLGSSPVLARPVPWTFHADFSHGFNGWMSYPLPQDIGFDPTLSVEQGILIRQVAGQGESRLSAGFIRPLHFIAGPGMRMRVAYTAQWPSNGATLKLLLAAANGRRYETALPAAGAHEITISGGQLKLPPHGVAMEAIVLVGSAPQSAKGAANRIELRELQLDAEREAPVRLAAPALRADPDRTLVAAGIVDPAVGLPLDLGAGRAPVQILLRDSDGCEIHRALAGGRLTISLETHAHFALWTAHLESAGATTDFSFLVLGDIPPHPRVLLSGARMAQLRSDPELAALRQRVHEQSVERTAKLKDLTSAGDLIARLPIGKTLRPSFNGELTEYFQTVEAYSNAIAWDALDYALTGNAHSLEAARGELLAVARWQTWTPPRFASHGMHTYYETGIFAQRLALAYDLIAGQLSAEQKREVADAFWNKCIAPTVEEYFSYNRIPTAASNWMANSMGGALAAAVAVIGDVPGWRAREGVALPELVAAYQHNLRGLFPGDGSEMEPAGYEHFAMQGLSWGAAALRNMGIRPAGITNMMQAFWSPDYESVRPDLVLDTGDFNGSLRNLSGFAFGAEFSRDPALRAFYDRVNTGNRAPDLLDLLCCTQAPQPAADAPLSRIFETRGTAVLRSGWGANDTVIELRAGPWFNHEHHDEGSFQVAAFGTRLISEAGYANYYLDPNYAAYFAQAPGHNTVLVDDDAFSQGEYGGIFWRALSNHPAIVDRLLSTKIDYVDANLAPAYGERVSTYNRQYVFLAPDVLIVRDNIRSAQPHVFTWLLHPAENATVEAHGSSARIANGTAIADVSGGGTAAWEMRPMPAPAAISQYLGNVLLRPGEKKSPKTVVLRLSSAKSTAARFEVAMQFHASTAAESGLKPVSTANATGFAGRAWALFRKAAGELRFRNLSTDGAVFAGSSPDEWMAIGARSVREGDQPLLTATAPVNVAWSRSRLGTVLNLHLGAPASIAVRANGTAVSVDGAPVRYRQENGHIELPPLPKGEHRVRIFT